MPCLKISPVPAGYAGCGRRPMSITTGKPDIFEDCCVVRAISGLVCSRTILKSWNAR